MEQFERFDVIDDNFGGPLVKIRNLADGEEMWCRRSRLKRYDGAWSLLTDRQYELLMATHKRQAAKANKATEPKIEREVAA